MKFVLLSLVFIFFSCFNSDSTENDKESEPSTIKDTIVMNGMTRVYFGPGTFSVPYENPAERLALSKDSENNYSINASPAKIGINESKLISYFHEEPKSSIILKTDAPLNAYWLNSNNELLTGAINGHNYLFIDDDQNGNFETLYLIQLSSSEPSNSMKTFVVGKVVKTDGSSINFAEAKKVLDTLTE